MRQEERRRRAKLGLDAALEAINGGEPTQLPSVVGVTVIVTHQGKDGDYEPVVETTMLKSSLAGTLHGIYHHQRGVDNATALKFALADERDMDTKGTT